MIESNCAEGHDEPTGSRSRTRPENTSALLIAAEPGLRKPRWPQLLVNDLGSVNMILFISGLACAFTPACRMPGWASPPVT